MSDYNVYVHQATTPKLIRKYITAAPKKIQRMFSLCERNKNNPNEIMPNMNAGKLKFKNLISILK